MKRYLDLIPISAKIHRKQSRMTRICITLAVFLVAVMFGLADMYLQGVTRQQMEENGNWHYHFHSIDTRTAAFISARPEVEISGWHDVISPDAGYSLNGSPVTVSAQEKTVFEKLFLNPLSEGNCPDAENEIAVSESLKESSSLSLGKTITLSRPDGSTVSYVITGFLADDDISRLNTGYSAETPSQIVAMTPEGASALMNTDESAAHSGEESSFVVRFSRLCNIPDTVEDIQTRNHLTGEQITGNTPLLSIEGQADGRSGVNQIYQVALVLSVIVLLTCILMISSSLNSSVAQRTEFFGMLRCLGATRRQIMRFVRCEGLYWCRAAIPAGILLSILVIWILSAVMRSMSAQWFSCMPRFGISWISIAAGALLGVLTVLLASRSPAKRAAKVSPLTAVSGNAGQTALFRKAAGTRHFKIETALGIHHAKAGKKNYLLMTGAFAICITLFLTFSTLIDFMNHAFVPPEYTPELSIASETNTCSIDRSLLAEVRENSAVKRAYGRMFAYDVPAEINGNDSAANIISYEENQFRWAAASLVSGSIEPAMQQKDQVLIVRTDHTNGQNIQPGDSISLLINGIERTVTAAGVLSDSPLARTEGTETIFCSEETFTDLTGETGYTIIDVQFQNNASSEDVEEIEDIFPGGVTFTDQLSRIQQQRNLYRAFAVLVYSFLSIIAAITVFHIMNTIRMGAAAKMREYGAMRAIGMSSRQLTKMIAAEAGTYAFSGIMAGCVIGLPMHWVIYVSLITNICGTAWHIPAGPLLLIIGIVLAASLLSIRGPVKQMKKMSIVENFKNP